MKGRVTFNWVKKGLLLITLGIGLMPGEIFAQRGLYIGLTAGPQLTNLQSNVGKFKPTLGFNAGGSYDIRLGGIFAITEESMISTIGAKKEYTQAVISNDRTNYNSYKTTDKFTYLRNNLMLNFFIPLGGKPIIPYDKEGSKMSLNFFIGPYFATAMNFSSSGTISTYTILNDGDTINKVSNVKYESDPFETILKVSPFDIGIVTGAGINFNLGENAYLGFEGRYSRGLSSIDYGYYEVQKKNEDGTKVTKSYANVVPTAISLNVSLKYRIWNWD